MIWEQHTLVIVMTTRVMERGRPKCHQYWETEEGAEATYGYFTVRTVAVETDPNYVVTTISLTNKKVDGLLLPLCATYFYEYFVLYYRRMSREKFLIGSLRHGPITGCRHQPKRCWSFWSE